MTDPDYLLLQRLLHDLTNAEEKAGALVRRHLDPSMQRVATRIRRSLADVDHALHEQALVRHPTIKYPA